MGKKDDNALVRQVLEGDTSAFRILVERHQARIFYLGLKFFHHPEEAEDFAQEVFLRAFQRLASFGGRVPFSAWLYRVAFNLAINRYHLNRRRFKEIDLNEQIIDPHSSPERVLLRREFKERIRKILKKLPGLYNILLKMHYFDGLSYPEISRASGIPVNTIKSHVFRAKKLIRARLKTYLGE